VKIGIIGAGTVGGTLGRRWSEAGHDVRYGLHDATERGLTKLRATAGDDARGGTIAEAGAFGTLVVLATPFGAAQDAIAAAGDLDGKVLIDVTNPITSDLSGLVVGFNTSAAEQVAGWAKGARVVKAFNSTGAGNMARPDYGDHSAMMVYCGDDAAAKAAVRTLISDLEFEPVDAGPLRQARLIEPLALLWITLAYKQGLGPDIAFGILRR
jgi:8-hydroxy-5-deazaflavin:NADPH oxidoreductase